MITSLVAGEPNDHLCSECSIRQLGVCAALDKADLRELAHLSRRIRYSAGETVFAQKEMTTSFLQSAG
jgi:CRP/FNR family transcriptional regulator